MSLPSALAQIKLDSNILQDIWYLVTAVIISSVNHPEDIHHVYKMTSTQIDNVDQISTGERDKMRARVVLRLREALLKSHVIIGFPKTINTLQQLSNVTPDTVKTLLPDKPLRGMALFKNIYNKHTDKVIRNMRNTHPDLAQTALYHLYGPTLSDTSILTPRETSLITVTGLMIQNIPLQLTGHKHGALHNGATKEDLNRVQSIVSTLADYYKMPIAKL
ncbi:AhpD-like protein [Pilobolus umbonatus]|nr:AhpD-like protein [Pilobolus umbonatus]